MSGPDLSPVKPYPGFSAGPEPTPAKSRPKVEPAEPAAWTDMIQLAFPLLVDGERLDSITIRRLTGRDVADLLLENDDETSLNVRARAAMADLHPDVIEALAADDAEAFARICRPFLPASLAAIEAAIAEDLAAAI